MLAEYAISALTGQGLEQLVADLAAFARDALERGRTRAGHPRAPSCCTAADAGGASTAPSPSAGPAGEELIAEELRLAARALGRLTGRVDVEDVLDVIFRDFCIGK